MDTLYRCCAGLDIHKETVVAGVRRADQAAEHVAQVAVESRGVCWKPVVKIRERHFQMPLLNAGHIK